ncbi:MAG: hypothetical protein AAF517_10940, partial [Planctomycetota bacterium]
LSASELEKVVQMVQLLQDDDTLVLKIRHELGSDDVARAKVLANPDEPDCLALATRLRSKKRELQASIETVSAEVATALSTGLPTARSLQDKLRGLRRELARADHALDELYELARSGTGRQAERRARAASVALGKKRVEAVYEALKALGLEGMEERIESMRVIFKDPANREGRVSMTPRKRQES